MEKSKLVKGRRSLGPGQPLSLGEALSSAKQQSHVGENNKKAIAVRKGRQPQTGEKREKSLAAVTLSGAVDFLCLFVPLSCLQSGKAKES